MIRFLVFLLMISVGWAAITLAYASRYCNKKPVAMMMAGLYPLITLTLFTLVVWLLGGWSGLL